MNMKFLSILLIIIINLTFNIVKGQPYKDTLPVNYRSSFNIDNVISPRWVNPVIGIMYETEVFDDDYSFSLQNRIGYYCIIDNNLKNGNMFIFQSAIIFDLNKKVSLGTYWFNIEKDYPVKKINPNVPITIKESNNIGFRTPLSIFARIDVNSIIKTGFFSQSRIYFEGNYYHIYNKGVFIKVIFNQRIITTHKKDKI